MQVSAPGNALPRFKEPCARGSEAPLFVLEWLKILIVQNSQSEMR